MTITTLSHWEGGGQFYLVTMNFALTCNGEGGGGDYNIHSIWLQPQMNEFMKEFQSERDDKLKAQANARQLKQDKEQLKDLQDKMQGQIFNLERERDDLKKIIEILV